MTLVENIVDMSIYLRGNLDLSDVEKISLCVELDMDKTYTGQAPNGIIGVDTIISSIEASHPNYTGKLLGFYESETQWKIYLKLRVFMRNSSEFRWRLSPKYGPFDVLYTKVGAFTKTYIDPTTLEIAGGTIEEYSMAQGVAIQKQVMTEMANQIGFQDRLTEGFKFEQGMFKFGKFALVTTPATMSAMSNVAGTAFYKYQPLYEDYLMYLKCNQTLAKWFYGKKSALQKINQDRVVSYLNKDKVNLKKVMHFFGGDSNFIDRRR